METEQDAQFVAFVGEVSPRLLSTAWMLTGDPHVAEELVQETLERVYVKWRRVAAGNPAAYARTVLANLHTDRWRRRRREVLVDEQLEAALSAAGPTDPRHVDLSEAQAAQTLGISVGTIKSSSSRGLEKLRTLMEGDDSRATV